MALKTPIIHCLLDAEPEGFHPASLTSKTLAVNLGFECLTDILRKEIAGTDDLAKAKLAELGDDEKDAEALFTAFVGTAQHIRLHLYEASSATPNDFTLAKTAAIAEQISDTAAPNAAADVTEWLGKAAPTKPAIRHYWTIPGEGAAGETTVEATAAPATYRLRAAQSWNAPVAHRLGLTHIIRLEGIVDGTRYLVLPLLAGTVPPASVTMLPTPAGTQPDAVWDFTYDPGGALGQIICRTVVLTAPDGFAIPPEQTIDFPTADGYLTVDPQAEDLWRVTKWFEARAASLMTPTAALSGPGAGAGAERKKDTDYDALFGWLPTSGPLGHVAPAAAWLATTSLFTALDNIIIAIMKPVSGSKSAGDVLAPVLLEVIDRFEKTVANAFDLTPLAYELPLLNTALREVLSANNTLFMKAVPLSTPEDRAIFTKYLRAVHGIAEAGTETPPETELLNVLLNCFQTDAETPISGNLQRALKDGGPLLLRRALAEAEQRLQDEAGAETAIIRMIELTAAGGKKLPRLFAEAYLKVLKSIPGAALDPAAEEALTAATENAFAESWGAYRTLLQGPFNGAEAVRRPAGDEFTKALLSAGKNPQHLIDAVREADYYTQRILRPGAPAPLCFDGISGSLATIPCPAAIDQTALATFLTTAYSHAVAPIALSAVADSRFIPDTSPAPLPIQIASSIDGEKIDDFSKYFNGIAVAIRRIDTPDRSDPWAHASLAELTWPVPPAKPASPVKVLAALHPMLPAASDGRGAMFIEYEGLPFAATAFRNTAADPIAETAPAFLPFYSYTAHDADTSDFAAIPRLAYGRTFETFSFTTTNAGTMPLSLQGALPWMPKAIFEAPVKDGKPDGQLVSTAAYQRRTAIGQMAVNETPTSNRPPRIGVPVEGVVPLAEDYPRTVLASTAGNPGVRDIFRDRNGAGTLSIPAASANRIEWCISGAAFSGISRRLVVRLFTAAPRSPIDTGTAKLRLKFPKAFDFGAIDKIVFGIETVDTGTGQSKRQFSVTCGSLQARIALTSTEDISEAWIRLSLESDTAASLSFFVTDDTKPYEVGAPLLMLAPKDSAWKSGLSEAVTLVVDTPRIGYLDFERWFANSSLRAAQFEDDTAKYLQRALLTAYVLRDADEGLARALDRLPDPAFEAVRLELAASDQLGDSPLSAMAHTQPFGFKRTMTEIMKALVAHGERLWTPADLHRILFKPIEKNFRFSIEIKAGVLGLSPGKNVVATVPEGMVARLSVDALVAYRHFRPQGGHPAVFHKGLKQHASRVLVDDASNSLLFAFPSAAMRIETMLNGMQAIDVAQGKPEAEKPAIQLAADMVMVRPIERSRRYDLETRDRLPDKDPEENRRRTRQWRLLSEVDVTSQRWRPSGRPIYNHIDPFNFRDLAVLPDIFPADAVHAALPVKEKEPEKSASEKTAKVGPLTRFEEEAFFDRPNIDSQTVTQRLLPLPAKTVLEQHVWDAPSASYFRHRFTLRSRYAGALTRVTDREVKAWIADREQRKTLAQAWTLRVAMLADLSRMLLTRPQQRALIPLTTAPRDDGEMPSAPPVLAVLQEPPFSRGGLADRIAAEIKTGFGYGFAADGNDTVEILDSRKEIGPDPRLDYRAMNERAALGMALSAEGPIGLTFDAVNAPAPAFPNSMFSLSPIEMSETRRNLEEHFLGVSMRRYIDPNWTVKHLASDPSALDAERCWWIGSDADLAAGTLLSYVADGTEAPLLTLEADGDAFVVKMRKAAIDGIAGTVETVALAHWSRSFANRLTILHLPVAPGRYSLLVFVLPTEDQGTVALGRSNAPLLACSFEWGPPKNAIPAEDGKPPKQTLPVTVTLKAPGAVARPTMASAPTFLAWARTGRNFDTLHSPAYAATTPALHQVPARDLVARLDGKSPVLTFDRSGIAEKYWLAPSTFLKPFPLHVQRHLAVLTTGYLKEPGRPVEDYRRSALLVGRTSAALAGLEGPDDCARIVEFETPAAILCGTGGSVPETYRRAYFDLVSTCSKTGNGPASARLFFRFAGPPAHLRTFKHMTIGLCFSENQKDRHDIVVNFKPAPKDTFVTAVELFIERAATPGKLSYRPLLLFSNGETGMIVSPPALVPNDLGLLAVDNPGFFLDIRAEGETGAGEFWTDVSLLHSPQARFGSGFDFNWLFSQAGGPEPAFEVTPAGLNTMVEAQARVVAVSPPIPIEPSAEK